MFELRKKLAAAKIPADKALYERQILSIIEELNEMVGDENGAPV